MLLPFNILKIRLLKKNPRPGSECLDERGGHSYIMELEDQLHNATCSLEVQAPDEDSFCSYSVAFTSSRHLSGHMGLICRKPSLLLPSNGELNLIFTTLSVGFPYVYFKVSHTYTNPTCISYLGNQGGRPSDMNQIASDIKTLDQIYSSVNDIPEADLAWNASSIIELLFLQQNVYQM